MNIRSAILESQKRDGETMNVRNKGFRGIAREIWVSDSIPGPRLIIVPSNYVKKGSYCEMVPYGMSSKYYGCGWEPSFDDLAANDWFVATMFRKVDLKGGDRCANGNNDSGR